MADETQNVKKIERDVLELGDIICTTGNAAISKAIRAVTGSQVSHTMMVSGGGKVIESVGEGVRECSLDDAFQTGGAKLAIVFRAPGLTEGVAHKVVDYARQQVTAGRKYDIRGIIAQAGYQLDRIFFSEEQAQRANLWLQDENKFFCSELIAAAYEDAGHPLVTGSPTAVSPQTIVELGKTDTLEYIGHLIGP
jgi:uncharacterized protein YycO